MSKLSGVTYGAMPRGITSGLVRPVRWIVLHATDNGKASAHDEAHYAATRTDDRKHWTSAHFYVDEKEVIGSVPLDMRAWAAYSEANAHGWHIEMCGVSGKVPATTIARTAELVRQLAEIDDVTVRHCTPAMVAAHQRGITGHADITEGLDVGTHTDPGPNFNWSAFISMVEGDDVVTPEDITKIADAVTTRVWLKDGIIDAPYPTRTKENPKWAASSILHYGAGNAIDANTKLTGVVAELTAQRAIIQTLSDALKAGGGGGDLDTAAVLSKLDGLVKQVADLQAKLTAAEAERDALNARLAAALAK